MTTLKMDVARKRLALVWFISGGFLITLVVVQSLGDKYGTKVGEAWEWLLPTIMPTMSLILGVLVAHRPSERQVDRFLYRIALGLSVFYLALVTTTFMAAPFVANTSTLELMSLSNRWLGPLQGLVAAGLSYFFAKPEVAGASAEPVAVAEPEAG